MGYTLLRKNLSIYNASCTYPYSFIGSFESAMPVIGSPFSVSFPVVMLKKPHFFAKLYLPGLSAFSIFTKNYKLQPIGGQTI